MGIEENLAVAANEFGVDREAGRRKGAPIHLHFLVIRISRFANNLVVATSSPQPDQNAERQSYAEGDGQPRHRIALHAELELGARRHRHILRLDFNRPVSGDAQDFRHMDARATRLMPR
jgi:hypothetical protein